MNSDNQAFDFIVVGAGSAGCVLANRLSADPSVRVLLLEAGGWDHDPLISIPLGARLLFKKGAYQWPDISEPDPGLNGRRMGVPHGKVMGGTSSINYMAHTRGHPADFDGWESEGAVGWSYRDVLPFFKECEAWERGEDRWRGGWGELGAIEAQTNDPMFEGWLNALRSLGHPITADYNGEVPEGFGPIQYTVKNGQRASTARVFLKPALLRPNLTVQAGALATEVLFDGLRAVGIRYVIKGHPSVARAERRVILSLGAINTPHLLMLSGVGPADHLRSMGIRLRVDLPVGQNLEDHLAFHLGWQRRDAGAFLQSLRLDRIGLNMLRAHFFHTGPAAHMPGAVIGFVRSKPSLPQPDLEFIMPMVGGNADYWFPMLKRAPQDTFGIRVQLVGQRSRGQVLLRSPDPTAQPRILHNSLSAPGDLETLRTGFKMAWDMGHAAALKEFRGPRLSPAREPKTDAEIDGFIRADAFHQYHPACTCRMGRAENAVLDPDLSVRGVQGLSVVDASAMPTLVSANANVAIIMMAAKAAVKIAQFKGP